MIVVIGNVYTSRSFHRQYISRRLNSPGYIPSPFYFYFYFSNPLYYFRLSFSVSLQVVTQIRGHMAGSSPPLPTAVRALHFYHEKISALSSLVDLRRLVVWGKTGLKFCPWGLVLLGVSYGIVYRTAACRRSTVLP